MKQNIFEKKTEALINEAIDAHKRYEEIFKSSYSVYLEYETSTKERRLELLNLMHQDDDAHEMYLDKLAELTKRLNRHDFDIAMRIIKKQTISDCDLWNDYFKWKSARSTMVV